MREYSDCRVEETINFNQVYSLGDTQYEFFYVIEECRQYVGGDCLNIYTYEKEKNKIINIILLYSLYFFDYTSDGVPYTDSRVFSSSYANNLSWEYLKPLNK